MFFWYLYVLHVCVMELFSEMLVFLQKVDNFSEVTVIVQSSVLLPQFILNPNNRFH